MEARDPRLGYSTHEVCELVGITYRMLDHWIRRSGDDPVFAPSLVKANGSGSKRRWSEADVERLRVIARIWGATGWMAVERRPRAPRGLAVLILAELFRSVEMVDGRLPRDDEFIDIVTEHGVTLYVWPN